MAEKKVLTHLNLHKQQLLNAALQVLGTAPTAPAIGQIYWNTTDNTAYIWTGSTWLDLGQIYTHPTYTGTQQPASALTGASIISSITLTNGHVTGVTTRNLTPAEIGAATSVHTHNFADVIGLPANTILANNTASTGAAKAITVAELLTMLAIGYGSLTLLNTGSDTTQRTWTAKDLTDWMNAKLSSYLTVVNLALGTRTANNIPITNSGGTGVTLPEATQSLAGLLTAADKIKLDGIAANANNYVHPTNNPGTHPFATELTSGLQILSQIVVNSEGHVVTIKGRNLTAADIASVMIVAGTNTTSTTQTWSAETINSKLQAAVTQVQTGALLYKGNYDPVTNTPNLTTDTTILTGYTYVVSTVGTFAGQSVEPGDMIIAKNNNPGTTAANWQIVNKNIPAIVSASTTVEGIVYLATVAEAQAGTNNTKAVTPAGLKAVLDSYTGGYYQQFGNGSSTSFTITHNLGTDRILVQIRTVATKEEVICDWRAASANTVTVAMNIAPANNEYEILITKT